MFNQVTAFIEKHQLISAHNTIVVGVSGGPDSMALLHMLQALKKKWDLTLIVAHVDHMFRGEVSYEDYRYVENYCLEHQIPFEGIRIDVTHYKKQKHLTSQVAARECRYRFYDEIMQKYQAPCLALAHHGDDQIETMLMRQTLSGTGFSTCGISVKRPFSIGYIIRPFLCLSKQDIHTYCKQVHIHPRNDDSNDHDTYVRNRFRHVVLPFLKEENPLVHKRFQMLSEQCFEDEEFLVSEAKKQLQGVLVKQSKCFIEMDRKTFDQVVKPLQRRVIHLILNYLYPEKNLISFVHIEDVLSLLGKEGSFGELHLPKGLIVRKLYRTCQFTFAKEQQSMEYRTEIPQNGVVQVAGGFITSEVISQLPSSISSDPSIFICDLHSVTPPLYVRSRKTGDRIVQKGIGGTKKVKDIFIDAKIDRTQRSTWPIITDKNDHILWIPKLKYSSYASVDPQANRFLMLKFNETNG